MVYTHIDVVAGTPRTGEAQQWNLMGHEVERLSLKDSNPVMASISRSTQQSIPNNSHARVQFDTVDFQSQPGMAFVGASARLVLPVNGIWLIVFTGGLALVGDAHTGVGIGTVRQDPSGGIPSSFTNTPYYSTQNLQSVGAVGLGGSAATLLTKAVGSTAISIDATMYHNTRITSNNTTPARLTYADLPPRLFAYLLQEV